MRSKTLPTLPGRCPRCWIRLAHCICDRVPTVATRTHVVLTRHERERFKSTGTARVAALALSHCTLVDYSDQPELAAARLEGFTDAWVLFPDDEGPRATADLPPPRHLIVLDGTWRQTRRMLKRLPPLQALPRLWLPAKAEAPLRLRESLDPEGRSTLEAVADALALLEGEAVAAPLRALHQLFVEQVFVARGVLDEKTRAHADKQST